MYGYHGWKPYVSVAERRKKAERELAKLQRKGKGQALAPVVLEGRKISTTFWGKAWCDNLESYSDYESRLPRGRSYLRNGLVVDLQVDGGEVKARVSGSELYTVVVKIAPLSKARWASICKGCSGSIDSLVGLLQGHLSKEVMERVCQQKTGLFPAPSEITLSCSCPDWASMCKHAAAVLYAIGVRLDKQPALVFKLRAVNEGDLIAGAAKGRTLTQKVPAPMKVLDSGDLSALFGLEMEGATPKSGPKLRPKPKAKATVISKPRSNDQKLQQTAEKSVPGKTPAIKKKSPSLAPERKSTARRAATTASKKVAKIEGRARPSSARKATSKR